MPLHAMRIPGIQDVDGDWTAVASILSNDLKIDTQIQNADPTGKSRDEWMETMLDGERKVLQTGGHEILIAHSFGTHRAIRHVQEQSSLKAAVLLNPPENTIAQSRLARAGTPMDQFTPEKAWSRIQPRTSMETLLWEVGLDMDDATFERFAQRHGEVNGDRAGRKKLSMLFEYLRTGEPFRKRFEQCDPDIPVVIVQSSDDPWRIENLSGKGLIQTVEVDRRMHYPHVSDPHQTAELIRGWLRDIGVLEAHVRAPLSANVTAEETATTSMVL